MRKNQSIITYKISYGYENISHTDSKHINTIRKFTHLNENIRLSNLIVTYSGHFFCLSPGSDMLEFDFHVLILHLMSSYSCVNNPVHIPANYRGDSRTIIIDKTRDLRIILFTFSISLLKLKHWTVLAFAYVFSIVFAEYVLSIVFAEYVFFIEMWIFIL